jgi:hypothetical protein
LEKPVVALSRETFRCSWLKAQNGKQIKVVKKPIILTAGWKVTKNTNSSWLNLSMLHFLMRNGSTIGV